MTSVSQELMFEMFKCCLEYMITSLMQAHYVKTLLEAI